MSVIDDAYTGLIQKCLMMGDPVQTRNSKCYRVIAHTETFVQAPLVSVRKTAWKNALREWEWFMSGSNNINDLHPDVRHWWEPWANKDTGEVKYNYSHQFRRSFGTPDDWPNTDDLSVHNWVDQVKAFIVGVRDHPFSRRNVITTWNTADMLRPDCPITNCHGTVIQAFVGPYQDLHLVTYQRSCDVVCGVPHNWIQYWAFLLWVAKRANVRPGSLTWIGGDVHVYDGHMDVVNEVIAAQREADRPDPLELVYTPTTDEFRAADFTLSGAYTPIVTTKAQMFV